MGRGIFFVFAGCLPGCLKTGNVLNNELASLHPGPNSDLISAAMNRFSHDMPRLMPQLIAMG